MDGYEYKIYMQENGLIESPQSAQDLVNVKRAIKNIENVEKLSEMQSSLYEAYGLDPMELMPGLIHDRDMYVKLAIRNAYNKEWAIETFGPLYDLQLNELKKNLEPTIASIGIIELKQQMGVFA